MDRRAEDAFQGRDRGGGLLHFTEGGLMEHEHETSAPPGSAAGCWREGPNYLEIGFAGLWDSAAPNERDPIQITQPDPLPQ